MSGVQYPENDFTQMIERTTRSNRAGGYSGVASAAPAPTVRSAALGEVAAEAPLTPEERGELDRLAREAGITDERVDERVGAADPLGNYASLEEAIAAGASVAPPAVPVEKIRFSRPSRADVFPQPFRLPDFRNVEGIDLLRNRVMLDGMEFPITDEEARTFKEFVVETARSVIMEKLNEADGLFSAPEAAEEKDGVTGATGEDAAVQQQPAGGGAEPPV